MEGPAPLSEQAQGPLDLRVRVLAETCHAGQVEAHRQLGLRASQSLEELRLHLVRDEVEEGDHRHLPERPERALRRGVVQPLGQSQDRLGHTEDRHDGLAVPVTHLLELHLLGGEADLLVLRPLREDGGLAVAVRAAMCLSPRVRDRSLVRVREVPVHAEDAARAARVLEQGLVVPVQDEVLRGGAEGSLHRTHAPDGVVGVGRRDMDQGLVGDLDGPLRGGHAPSPRQLGLLVDDLLQEVAANRPQLIGHLHFRRGLDVGDLPVRLLLHHEQHGLAVELLGLRQARQELALAHQLVRLGQQLVERARLDGLVGPIAEATLQDQGDRRHRLGDGSHASMDPWVLCVGSRQGRVPCHLHHPAEGQPVGVLLAEHLGLGEGPRAVPPEGFGIVAAGLEAGLQDGVACRRLTAGTMRSHRGHAKM